MRVFAMMAWVPLLLQTRALPDTIVTIQVPAARSWMDSVVAGGQVVVSLAVLALLAAVVVSLLALRRSMHELTNLFRSSYGDLSAAAHSVRNVADDVRGITQSVKGDVEVAGETVRLANDKVRGALERAEERFERLDALVEVAQEEAEEFVVSAAAALRGARRGASVLRQTFQFARRNGKHRPARRKSRAATGARRWKTGDQRPRIRERDLKHT